MTHLSLSLPFIGSSCEMFGLASLYRAIPLGPCFLIYCCHHRVKIAKTLVCIASLACAALIISFVPRIDVYTFTSTYSQCALIVCAVARSCTVSLFLRRLLIICRGDVSVLADFSKTYSFFITNHRRSCQTDRCYLQVDYVRKCVSRRNSSRKCPRFASSLLLWWSFVRMLHCSMDTSIDRVHSPVLQPFRGQLHAKQLKSHAKLIALHAVFFFFFCVMTWELRSTSRCCWTASQTVRKVEVFYR